MQSQLMFSMSYDTVLTNI